MSWRRNSGGLPQNIKTIGLIVVFNRNLISNMKLDLNKFEVPVVVINLDERNDRFNVLKGAATYSLDINYLSKQPNLLFNLIKYFQRLMAGQIVLDTSHIYSTKYQKSAQVEEHEENWKFIMYGVEIPESKNIQKRPKRKKFDIKKFLQKLNERIKAGKKPKKRMTWKQRKDLKQLKVIKERSRIKA